VACYDLIEAGHVQRSVGDWGHLTRSATPIFSRFAQWLEDDGVDPFPDSQCDVLTGTACPARPAVRRAIAEELSMSLAIGKAACFCGDLMSSILRGWIPCCSPAQETRRVARPASLVGTLSARHSRLIIRPSAASTRCGYRCRCRPDKCRRVRPACCSHLGWFLVFPPTRFKVHAKFPGSDPAIRGLPGAS